MPDSSSHRMKFWVIAPSTNTSVQPEFDAMVPSGITNHMYSGRHQPCDGTVGHHGRALVEQTGERDQRGDLLARATHQRI
jgi:hypothetical protein